VALATREGARVLGLGDRVGTLSPGKQADLIVVDLNQAHLTPLYDPYSHLVYAARSADVCHVMVAGSWLLWDRRFLTLDWRDLASRARDNARNLTDFMGALQKM
jgi:5-methylthioadenosine/S-adenosylhomocysteine deaminase